MDPWYFQCHSMTAWKVPRWFHNSPGIMHPWLVWWMWCWRRNVVEGLWRLEGVNIPKGQVRAEGVERSHMAAENIREQWRMLRMKFYITEMKNSDMQLVKILMTPIVHQVWDPWRILLLTFPHPFSLYTLCMLLPHAYYFLFTFLFSSTDFLFFHVQLNCLCIASCTVLHSLLTNA